MKFRHLHFAIDKTKKAQSIKKKLFKIYKNNKPKKADVIVVIGGDGFMLETLKKYKNFKKAFYGMNKGTFGFLMNKFNIKNINRSINKSKLTSISPLEIVAFNKKKIKRKFIAINEISLLRQSKQTASLKISSHKKVFIKKLICDGVLVCTPAGSTAYNLSVHGPILSLDSKKLAITPISAFRPRRWKGKIVSENSVIKIENLNIKKRPVSLVADNVEFRNIKRVAVRINKNNKLHLLYDKNNSLNKKIKLEQLRKQTN